MQIGPSKSCQVGFGFQTKFQLRSNPPANCGMLLVAIPCGRPSVIVPGPFVTVTCLTLPVSVDKAKPVRLPISSVPFAALDEIKMGTKPLPMASSRCRETTASKLTKAIPDRNLACYHSLRPDSCCYSRSFSGSTGPDS